MEICMQVYGEHSLLTSRLYINIGIVYEDNKDYVKAYECFCKWAEVSEIVLGPTHPKTLRAKGVLKEPRYRLIAMRLKRQDGVENDGLVHNDHISESSINQEVEELDDDYSSLHQSGIAGIESDDEERADGEPLSDHSDLPRSDIQELYLAFSDLIHQATLAQIERAQNVLDEVSDVYDDDSPGDNRDTEEWMVKNKHWFIQGGYKFIQNSFFKWHRNSCGFNYFKVTFITVYLLTISGAKIWFWQYGANILRFCQLFSVMDNIHSFCVIMPLWCMLWNVGVLGKLRFIVWGLLCNLKLGKFE